MSASAGTGVLDPCVCRVSVRKVEYMDTDTELFSYIYIYIHTHTHIHMHTHGFMI